MLDELANELLSVFTLEELLEMNDIQEEENLLILLERGLIHQPESIIRQFELDYEDE